MSPPGVVSGNHNLRQPVNNEPISRITMAIRADHRFRKLKMPLFYEADVYGLVYQAGRFFEVKGLNTTGERLRAAVLSLEGLALSWFRWINNQEPFRNWEELKRRLLHRFQSSQDEEVLGGVFIKGLKPELRTSVKTHQLANLSQVMELNLLIDESRTGHRCALHTLQVMIVDDSDEENEPYLQVKPWDRALKAD
uniref:Ankyrin repeat-containing protein n=1 Tax=Tanacetum cinerariifolium TaxID=118510 RepID=A0A699IJW6_TANCI|nr:ankyrin repeat-containing protein [Tanacetum cinerariifolium]